MKTLSDMSIFKYVESTGASRVTKSVVSLIDEKTGAILVTEQMLEDAFYKLRHKSFNYTAKFAVIELFRKGKLKLIYNPSVKLTVAYPFFKHKQADGSFACVINLSNYAKLMDDNSIRIDATILYVLMLAGAHFIATNEYIEFIGAGIAGLYADLMVSVISRLTTVNDMTKLEFRYIFRKFMTMQLGVDEVRASAGAAQNLDLSKEDLIKLDMIAVVNFSSLEALITKLREIYPCMASITFGVLFNKWSTAYGEATAFALEYVPAFSLLFIALVTNCIQLVNVKAIEKEASRRSSKFMALFARMETIVVDFAQGR